MDQLKDKNKKIGIVLVRMSPIMEILTGIMIAILIYYSGKLIMKNELQVNNFFSFLAAMMLAYQPVRSLSTMNMVVNQGYSAATRILPIVDTENMIKDRTNATDLNISKGNIEIKNVYFKYDVNENNVLENITLNFEGGKMTALVGHSGSGKSTILNLIPRFYQPYNGDLLIDNQSIYDAKNKFIKRKYFIS